METTINGKTFEIKQNGTWETDTEIGQEWLDVDFCYDGRVFGVGIITKYLTTQLDDCGNTMEAGDHDCQFGDRRWPDMDDFMLLLCGTADPNEAAWIIANDLVGKAIEEFDREIVQSI